MYAYIYILYYNQYIYILYIYYNRNIDKSKPVGAIPWCHDLLVEQHGYAHISPTSAAPRWFWLGIHQWLVVEPPPGMCQLGIIIPFLYGWKRWYVFLCFQPFYVFFYMGKQKDVRTYLGPRSRSWASLEPNGTKSCISWCSEGAARRFFYQRLKAIWIWYMIYDIWYIIWFFHDDLPNFTRFFHVGSYLSNPLLWSLGWFMIPQVQAALQVPNAMLQRSSKLTGAKVTTLKVKNRFSTYKMYESWCLIWYVVKSSL